MNSSDMLGAERSILAAVMGAALCMGLGGNAAHAQETHTYKYDVLGRLIEADHGTKGSATYTYDEADNRQSVSITETTGSPPITGVIVLPLNGFTIIPLN